MHIDPLIDIADDEIRGFDPGLRLDSSAVEEERSRTRVSIGSGVRSVATACFASMETSYVFAAPLEATLAPVFVIQPEFDSAFPFEDGYAVVCNGCRALSRGDHGTVEDGKWGVTDPGGRVVIPLAFEKHELQTSPQYLRLLDSRRASMPEAE